MNDKDGRIYYVKSCIDVRFSAVYHKDLQFWSYYARLHGSYTDMRVHAYDSALDCYGYLKKASSFSRREFEEWLSSISLDLLRNYGMKSNIYKNFIVSSNSFYYEGGEE